MVGDAGGGAVGSVTVVGLVQVVVGIVVDDRLLATWVGVAVRVGTVRGTDHGEPGCGLGRTEC